jgi:hypothetical protein
MVFTHPTWGGSSMKTLQQIRGFRVVHVLDISQTEGEEIYPI